MVLSFSNTSQINYYEWFVTTIELIYGIADIPRSPKGLDSYVSGHSIVRAYCDTEFNNWADDVFAADYCTGSLLAFKQEGEPFVVKMKLTSMLTAIGSVDNGMFKIDDNDPYKEAWLYALREILPNLAEKTIEIHLCAKECQILEKYWIDD